MELTLERKAQVDDGQITPNVSMTPSLGEDYWEYRVRLTDKQAVVGFPKFNTIGIGFAVEEDWNTNLPYTSSALEIAQHIAHNKGDKKIKDADVLAAILLIQDAATEDRTPKVTPEEQEIAAVATLLEDFDRKMQHVKVRAPYLAEAARLIGVFNEIAKRRGLRIGGRWAMRELVLLHEIAHHLAPLAKHDGPWQEAYLDLIGNVVGPEAALLLRVFIHENSRA